LTPREFSALHKRCIADSESRQADFRFLATVITGKNYMSEKRKAHKRGGMSLDDTEGFFMALAGKTNGA
jgi:hypothetical protein